MKYVLRTFGSLTAVLALTACGADEFCDVATCVEGSGGSTSSSSASGAQGTGSTASTSSSQPTTTTQSGGGGDGGSSGSDGGGGDGQGAGGNGSGGDGGGGGTVVPTCDYENGEVDESCAIFVDGDNDDIARDGTRGSPYNSITEAITPAQNQGKTIFVCMSTQPYVEALEIDDSVSLVGGFGCANWPWSADDRTEWTAGAGEVPLKVTGGADLSVSGFAISAASAEETTPGGSSLGILVVDSSLILSRSDVTAGDGQDGESPTQLDRADRAASGTRGHDGCDTADPDAGDSPDGGANSCGGDDRSGGPGGPGTTGANGFAGSPGNPENATNVGGERQPQMDGDCTAGAPGGATSPAGDDGVGAEGVGALNSSGFVPQAGGVGTPGMPGFGGGGGGGAHKCLDGKIGPSGGSGGAGGCGGQAGNGGGGGGSSIAIALLHSSASFTDVTTAVGTGGDGGDGAQGQFGQQGGLPGQQGVGVGDGSAIACVGGSGSNGGSGGNAGGGLGGHASGIAWAGSGGAPNTDGVSFAITGVAGVGGERLDGLAAGRGNNGLDDNVIELDD